MKLRIEKKYPYHDTHCGGNPEPYYAIVDIIGNEIGHFKKEYPYHDTHCGGSLEPYYVFVDKNGNEIGHFKKEYPYHDSHCSTRSQPNNVFIYNRENNNHETNETQLCKTSLQYYNKPKSKTKTFRK